MPRKKLIEVALPLDAINAESAREKSIRHGHPSTLHLWWARRPLATCRAVLYSSLVDDPSDCPHFRAEFEAQHGRAPEQYDEDGERERIFAELTALVKWENSTNESVLAPARARIRRCCDGNPPPVLDPFCGGGSIPLEAQRLGLEAHASDLNPVAVLITKALIEIPPTFAGKPPVNPDDRRHATGAAWQGAAGLAADVRHYGRWMRDEAERRIGHLYPKGPNGETVIAWLWARTVRCPNPACGAQMPLVRSFWLSTKPGKETYVQPVVDAQAKTVRFEVRHGKDAPEGTKRRADVRCLFCDQTLSEAKLRSQAKTLGMGSVPMAMVLEGKNQRVYMGSDCVRMPTVEAPPVPEIHENMPENPRWFSPPGYGLPTFADLFTPRQLVALTTFSDLVGEARQRALHDAVAAGLPDDSVPLADGGHGATAYGDAWRCTWRLPWTRLRIETPVCAHGKPPWIACGTHLGVRLSRWYGTSQKRIRSRVLLAI